jgi:DNA polymerase III subunit epsilon
MYYKPSNVPFGLPWRQPTNLLVKVASEAPSPQEVALPKDTETTETMARTLEATGNYKILRRLVPRTAEPSLCNRSDWTDHRPRNDRP